MVARFAEEWALADWDRFVNDSDNLGTWGAFWQTVRLASRSPTKWRSCCRRSRSTRTRPVKRRTGRWTLRPRCPWRQPACGPCAPPARSGAASSDGARAQAFADTHGIARAHAGHHRLLDDQDLDVVYVATTNDRHHADVGVAEGGLFVDLGAGALVAGRARGAAG